MSQSLKISVLTALALCLCGCQAFFDHFDGKAQYYKQKVILHDTVYDDYYDGKAWQGDKHKAKHYLYYEALRWLDDFRINERGEYCNEGWPTYYPIKIEAAK